MSISEAQRFDMHRGLRDTLGDDVADTLMEHLPPTGWGDVARTRDIDRLEARIDRLDARIDRLETRFSHLESRLEMLHSEFFELRDDLTQRLDTFGHWAIGLAITYGTVLVGVLTAIAFTR